MQQDYDRASLLDDGFSVPAARTLAAMCKLAYADTPTVEAALRACGLQPLVVFDIEDTQGFAAADDQVAIVSFRGTESTADWIRNLKIRRTATDMGKVHRGFQDGAEKAWNRFIEPALRPLADSGQRIWFTGHSLGGALATAAAALARGKMAISGCYTYGQPLVGNDDFAYEFNQAYGGRFFRLVNNRDIVTKIPPAPLYQHVDTRFQIDADGNIAEEVRTRGFGGEAEPEALDIAEFEALQAQLQATAGGDMNAGTRGFLPDFMGIQGIEDHDIEGGYLRQLRASDV